MSAAPMPSWSRRGNTRSRSSPRPAVNAAICSRWRRATSRSAASRATTSSSRMRIPESCYNGDARRASTRRGSLMFLADLLKPKTVAYAHCDLPCGVYDPEQARIEAESCYKIIEKYNASSDEQFKTRAIVIKEERAELAKHHIDVLWSDYFKPEHVQKYPEITELCW